MIQLAIRCHPSTPVTSAELHEWLTQRLDQLRAEAPQAIVRLSHMTQALPDTEMEMGWLIELELPDEVLLAGSDFSEALADAFTDMRFLGLQPILLTPDQSEGTSKNGVGVNGPVLDYPGLQ